MTKKSNLLKLIEAYADASHRAGDGEFWRPELDEDRESAKDELYKYINTLTLSPKIETYEQAATRAGWKLDPEGQLVINGHIRIFFIRKGRGKGPYARENVTVYQNVDPWRELCYRYNIERKII